MKNKILNFLTLAVCAAILTAGLAGLFPKYAKAQAAAMEGVLLRLLSSTGLPAWQARVNSSGQLEFDENTNINGAVLTVDDNDGSLALRSRTSAQIQALAPSAAGELLINSTANIVCKSTGTGIGAWVVVIASRTAAQVVSDGTVFPVCY